MVLIVLIYIGIGIGCRTQEDSSESTVKITTEHYTNPHVELEACENGHFFVPAEEELPAFQRSVNDLIEMFNQQEYCLWENDGSKTNIRMELVEYEEFHLPWYEDDIYILHFSDDDSCRYIVYFYVKVLILSETNDLIAQIDGQAVLEGYYFSLSGNFYDANLPPSFEGNQEWRKLRIRYSFNDYNPKFDNVELKAFSTDGVLDQAQCYNE